MELTIPEDSAFRIQLPAFEGPLDLLLHLIKRHELDILDLPISFVTERYLEYLSMMRELDLDIAAEYLVMAATLAHIKSKMLLPAEPMDEDEEDEEPLDPRQELIRRLLEYQKYRAVAEELGQRPVTGRDVFVRRAPAVKAASEPAPLADVSLFKLLDVFEDVLSRVEDRRALEVSSERITLQERISELTDVLHTRRDASFRELFDGSHSRYEVVVTLLAILEMARVGVLRLYQSAPEQPIHVHYALLDAEQASEPPVEAAAPEPAVPEPEATPSGELPS